MRLALSRASGALHQARAAASVPGLVLGVRLGLGWVWGSDWGSGPGGVEFEHVPVNVMAGEKCKPNPTGSVPYIEDPATDVSMGEGLAILVHLCETHSMFASSN